MAERWGNAIRFARWNGGEFGTLDAGLASEGKMLQHRFDAFYNYARVQLFTANNCCVYTTGLLGPRPGLKRALTTTTVGTLQGMDTCLAGTGNGPWFWICIAGLFYQVDLGAGTVSAAYTGPALTAAAAPTKPLPVGGSYGTGTILPVFNVGTYYLTHGATKTITNINTTMQGSCIGYYGQRFAMNSSDASGGDSRLFYSGAFPGWGTYDPNAYYDIGSALGITLIRPYRDGLMLGKENGEVWHLSGVLGSTAIIKQLSRSGAPWTEPRGLMLDSNEMWYMGYRKPYPSSFNGALHQDWKNLQYTGGVNQPDSLTTAGHKFVALSWIDTKSFMILSGQAGAQANRMLLQFNDVFTYHTFGVNVDPWGVDMGANAATSTGSSTNAVIVADGAGGKYYWLQPDLDRPGFVNDAFSQPGDDSTVPLNASFSTPEFWEEQGHEMKIQQVQIDYRGWNTGATTPNGFTVQVNAIHRMGDVATTPGTVQQAVSALGTTYLPGPGGEDRRVIVNVGDQGYGSGFNVTIGSLQGCAIRSITAVIGDIRRP